MAVNEKKQTGGTESRKADREIALDIIMDVMERGEFSHILLRKTFEHHGYLEKSSRKFITRLTEGTIEKAITLDYILNRYSKIRVDKMKPLIRNILRMSLYQLKYMSGIPESAVCNEAVKITRKRGFQNLSGFVNGVLRNILRTPEQAVIPDGESETSVSGLSAAYSMPEWLVIHFLDSYGMDITRNILKGILEAAEDTWTTVRVNTSKIGLEQAEKLLIQEGVEVQRTLLTRDALRIRGYDMLDKLLVFRQGMIQVQNLSSILAGQTAGVRPGNLCIDVCAAPGGKTLHLADLLRGTGSVISRDISEKKCSLIRENMKRAGFRNIKVQVWNALNFDESAAESADLVIADVPCSGLGVMAEKPDIKYRLRPEQLQELAELSQKILNHAVKYIRNGGILLFSTCTLNPRENTEIRQWLIKEHGLVPEDIRPMLSEELLCMGNNRMTAADGYLQLLPSAEMDGFFISRFRKTEKVQNNGY
ncbi:MAG: 16S rRNA (cytosine(967)-C(5))-methyltransferase RsmB [Lachnospiraceae bacterium]|nr:16S rRNA (cytosine(967)-C(5))-methyltransferase RsmB [Lachnospiraceae bacterium]